jgi:hypothetical protein
LFRGAKPIFFRRSLRTSSVLPEFISERGDVIMAERLDAMSNRSRLSLLVSLGRVFEGLPRLFVSGQVLRLPVLASCFMSMRGAVV